MPTIADVVKLLQYLVGNIDLTPSEKENYNVTNTGTPHIGDAVAMLNMLVQ
jgi:hypothetical protein